MSIGVLMVNKIKFLLEGVNILVGGDKIKYIRRYIYVIFSGNNVMEESKVR